MSWRFYDTLTVQPNFDQAPEAGIVGSGRTLIDFASVPIWAAWHGDTPLSFRNMYRLDSAAELRTFRNFMNQIGGKSVSFFIPTWFPDFELAAPIVAGATAITIKAAGLSEIIENRPDTQGRQLFVLLPDGQLQTFGITDATLDGDNEILEVDQPAAFSADVDSPMVGRLYLVRLADDQIEYSMDTPGSGSVSIAMVTSRQTRHVEDAQELESDAVYALREFVDVLSYDQNPLIFRYDQPVSIGPVSYGSASPRYATEWNGAWSGGLRLTSSIGTEVTTPLFDGSSPPAHWTFCFNAGGREIVAWARPEGTVRIGFRNGLGDPTHVEFPGYAPQAFNTYEIDSTATAGDSDAIIFYLRKGFSGIFGRFAREDFAIEHLLARSPTAPIYLQRARANGSKIELIGMDAGHRLSYWRAGDYVPPIDPEIASHELDGFTLAYDPINVIITAPTEAPNEHTIGAFTLGYEAIRVGVTAPTDPGGSHAISTDMTVEYVSVRTYLDIPGEDMPASSIDSAMTLGYVLVTKFSQATDGAANSIDPTITIGYAP